MKNILQQIAHKNRQQEKAEYEAIKAEMANPSTTNDRRSFLKKAALGGIAIGGMMNFSIEDTIAQTTSKVQRSSSPSELKITDMRVAVIGNVGRTPLIRIDTNQGIYGLGEVRDGADERYALFLKSRILGLNPCNVEMLFKIIRQYGYHGRQGGGVCAVEMALWDLCGESIRGSCVAASWRPGYRNKIRLYADTPGARDPKVFAETMKRRVDGTGIYMAEDGSWNSCCGKYPRCSGKH